MTIIDIGHKHAGLKVSFNKSSGMITVLSHGKGDRREVEFDHYDSAAREVLVQATVLDLLTLLPCAVDSIAIGDFIEREIIHDQS